MKQLFLVILAALLAAILGERDFLRLPPGQRDAVMQASRIAHSPSALIRSDSSASGMKSSGRTIVPARCQRSSASNPTVRRDGSSTTGW